MWQKNHTTFSWSTVSPWLLSCCLFASFFVSAPLAHAAEPSSLLDTDHDGLPDIWEQQVFHTNPLLADTDGDGVSDRDEILRGTNPLGKGALVDTDTDGDGLPDRLELLFGTDPLTKDTDGDGFLDGEEVFQGYSPTSTGDIHLPKSIHIFLDTQHLQMRVMDIPIASFLVSTGLPHMPTPVGAFKVLSKNPRAWSHSAHLWMPYWMNFRLGGYGIHELPEWPNGHKEGENHLGHLASHGCVRLGVGSAKEVYDWSPIGTSVIIEKASPKEPVTQIALN